MLPQETPSGVWAAPLRTVQFSSLGRPARVPSLPVHAFGKHFHALLTVTVDDNSCAAILAVGNSVWCLISLSLLTAAVWFPVTNRKAVRGSHPTALLTYSPPPHCSPFSPHDKVTTEGSLCIEYLF